MLNRTIASDFYVLLLAAINRAARMWRTGEGTLMQRRWSADAAGHGLTEARVEWCRAASPELCWELFSTV